MAAGIWVSAKLLTTDWQVASPTVTNNKKTPTALRTITLLSIRDILKRSGEHCPILYYTLTQG